MLLLRRFHPALAMVLVAAALLLRAGLPAGWMPVAGGEGLHIAICTGQGGATLELGVDGRMHEPAPGESRDPCPFGLAAANGFDLPATVASPPAPVAQAELRGAALAARADRPAAVRIPPARGPPHFA